MQLYADRILKQQQRRNRQATRELRDAVVMDVTPTSNYCRVKIQGSDEFIVAHYNENWVSIPQWLKPGNSVRITTPAGNKGKIEVAGHGFLLPTSVAGGSVTPDPTEPGDAILTGIVLTADGSGMTASVSTGTYRINGITYVLGAMTMNDTAIVMNRADLIMGGSAASVTFGAASSTQYRIDIIEVGINGDVDVVAGTPATGEPTQPSTSTDHVLIGWVLIHPNMTIVTTASINASYGTSIASALALTDSTDDFILSWTDETCNFTVKVVDQYNNVVSGTYFLTVAFSTTELGNGTLVHGSQSLTNTGVSMEVTFDGNTSMTYTRTVLPEPPGPPSSNASSPTFTFTESSSGVANVQFIDLLDISNDTMF